MSRVGGLGSGHATFASCNKAGSIPHFSAFLRANPGNFEALKWRGRAYSIIGKIPEAVGDFQTAERHNSAPYNSLARSELAFLEGNIQQGVDILVDTIKLYPRCGEAWSDLGSRIYLCGSHDTAIEPLKKSIELGNASGESGNPWHFWAKDNLGEIYYINGDMDTAEWYYSSAVQSCPTFTKAHLGVGRCNVIKRNMSKAEGCYRRARELNPTITPWTTFQEFVNHVESNAPQTVSAPSPQRQPTASNSIFNSAYSAITSVFNSALGFFTTPQSTHAVATGSGNNRPTDQTRSNVSSRNTSRSQSYLSSNQSTSSNRQNTPPSRLSSPQSHQNSPQNTPSNSYNGAPYRGGSDRNGGNNSRGGGGNSRSGGGGRGGNGGGDGNGSDDDRDDSVWKRFSATKPTKMRDVKTNRDFRQVGDSKYWLSRDKAEHSGAHSINTGSFFKLFIEKGRTLDLIGSVPITIFKKGITRNDVILEDILEGEANLEDFDIINKWESHAGEQVKKADLKLVRTKPKRRS